jgi:hypothetical protein
MGCKVAALRPALGPCWAGRPAQHLSVDRFGASSPNDIAGTFGKCVTPALACRCVEVPVAEPVEGDTCTCVRFASAGVTFFSPFSLHCSASSIATRMACALSGAGMTLAHDASAWVPSAFENCTAAANVSNCLTARASTPAPARSPSNGAAARREFGPTHRSGRLGRRSRAPGHRWRTPARSPTPGGAQCRAPVDGPGPGCGVPGRKRG